MSEKSLCMHSVKIHLATTSELATISWLQCQRVAWPLFSRPSVGHDFPLYMSIYFPIFEKPCSTSIFHMYSHLSTRRAMYLWLSITISIFPWEGDCFAVRVFQSKFASRCYFKEHFSLLQQYMFTHFVSRTYISCKCILCMFACPGSIPITYIHRVHIHACTCMKCTYTECISCVCIMSQVQEQNNNLRQFCHNTLVQCHLQ